MNRTFKAIFTSVALMAGLTGPVFGNTHDNISREHDSKSELLTKKWIHGSQDCETNTDSAIDVLKYDQFSYVLRQNKCATFEAPFIYVLIGKQQTLVVDTGAIENEAQSPVYETVMSLLKDAKVDDANRELLVLHSHQHGDHCAGDSQFEGKPNVTLVKPDAKSVNEFLTFDKWNNGEVKMNLGARELTVFATPGHQEEAITIYDAQTGWLLTGDTFYPGYVYVKDWEQYKKSIAAMVTFSEKNNITAVLGAHIEMTNSATEYYPIGTTYQPDEAPLMLTVENLNELHEKLKAAKHPQTIVTNHFIVSPMNVVQKSLSNLFRWFGS